MKFPHMVEDVNYIDVKNMHMWRYTYIIPLGILLTTPTPSSGAFYINKYETTVEEHALVGYNFSSLRTSSEIECFQACVENDCKCASFNFKKDADKDGMHHCELNYETKDVAKMSLKRTIGYSYSDINYNEEEKKCALDSCFKGCCKYNPCQNNSTCTDVCDNIKRVSCNCTPGFVGRFCEKAANSCSDHLQANNSAATGQYTCFINGTKEDVYCLMDNVNMTATMSGPIRNLNMDNQGSFAVVIDLVTAPGDWIIIQRRMDGSVDFLRTWSEYKNGFGSLHGEFWHGLDYLHRLTAAGYTTLRVDLWDWEGQTAHAEYSTFNVGDEASQYLLTIGGYSGNAANSLVYNNNQKFYTTDRDSTSHKCVALRESCFWFNGCSYSNLNGVYIHSSVAPGDWKGISWDATSGTSFRGKLYSMKRAEMKIRKP